MPLVDWIFAGWAGNVQHLSPRGETELTRFDRAVKFSWGRRRLGSGPVRVETPLQSVSASSCNACWVFWIVDSLAASRHNLFQGKWLVAIAVMHEAVHIMRFDADPESGVERGTAMALLAIGPSSF